jgi:hypothetical protein
MSRSRPGVAVRLLRNPYSVHWTDPVFEDITAKLVQLGLRECKVCESETGLYPNKLPAVLPVGGLPESRLTDSETNIVYMVQVECIRMKSQGAWAKFSLLVGPAEGGGGSRGQGRP